MLRAGAWLSEELPRPLARAGDPQNPLPASLSQAEPRAPPGWEEHRISREGQRKGAPEPEQPWSPMAERRRVGKGAALALGKVQCGGWGSQVSDRAGPALAQGELVLFPVKAAASVPKAFASLDSSPLSQCNQPPRLYPESAQA